jgi:hypothetical protein
MRDTHDAIKALPVGTVFKIRFGYRHVVGVRMRYGEDQVLALGIYTNGAYEEKAIKLITLNQYVDESWPIEPIDEGTPEHDALLAQVARSVLSGELT